MCTSSADIKKLGQEILQNITDAASELEIEAIRVRALGKKGLISGQLRGLGHMGPEERRVTGRLLNETKGRIAEAIVERRNALKMAALNDRLAGEHVDVTLPARPRSRGTIHPISRVYDEVIEIFADMGFSVAEGPHIEDDFHNFTALNIPPEHPARQEHDTFYFKVREDGSRMVLRTHTSPVQVRVMQTREPPFRVIAPGRVFRCDSDQTHTPMFHQIEGLVIEDGIHLGHLKWVLESFCESFFGIEGIKMRFRPSYFPFTEPSMEVDIGCRFDDNRIRMGEGDDWLETAGAGMVHPNVLEACGLDSYRHQGFAFGMGLDRLAMLKYAISDLRAFFTADLRWLHHYGFSAFDTPTLAQGLS
ncbi:MAG: phenylalanine--tRNA ligase subunit alpha [Hyphomicrobiales bacterium]